MRNRLKYYWMWLWVLFFSALAWLWSKTPWYKAYALDSFRRYLESDWYKERSSISTKAQALKMYFDSNESWFFKRKITRREKIRIMICPFSTIEAAKKSFRRYKIHDYL